MTHDDHRSFPFYRDLHAEGLSLLATERPFYCPRKEGAHLHQSLYVHVRTIHGDGCMMREAYDLAPKSLFIEDSK
jgi:hypothetical protein